MHLALAVWILSPLITQDSQERVPVPAGDPVQVADDPVLVREVPRPLAEGTRIVRYELAHLTGHDALEPWDDRLDDAQDPFELRQALDLLDRFQDRRIAVQETTESLLSSVRDMMVPLMEEDIQRVEHVGDGAFVLVGTPAQHAWMVQFIAAADGFNGLIDIEAQIFVLERGKLAAFTPDRSGAVLDAPMAMQLAMDLKNSGADAVLIQTPEVTRIKLEGAFAMTGGESLLLVTADPTGRNDVIVILKADRMEVPEDLAPGR